MPGSGHLLGAVAAFSRTRLAVEVSHAKVQTLSFRVGVAF